MKFIYPLLLLLICFPLNAQTDITEGRHFFNKTIQLSQCDFAGTIITPATPNKEVIQKGWIFTIENIDGNEDYIIQVAKFTGGSSKSKAQNLKTFQDSNFENIYFKLSKNQYTQYAERWIKRGQFIVGASTTLVKIRFGNGERDEDKVIYSEFGNDFNVGITCGYRFTPNFKSKTSISAVGGISFTSIKVTPETTRNFIESESNQSAITFSGGLVFEINKFQISLFTGIDAMSGKIGKNWIHRNRPWLGIGFGFQIFKTKGATDN
ncbi:hypothetical protein [Kordia sp.]|uniref:hypothetical protein n=1 Tax=Kordia sp. TaxID=1965332 RepID=UPI003D2A1174